MQKQRGSSDIFPTAVLISATVLLFLPVIVWIARQSLAEEQLRQSLMLLIFAAVFVALDPRRRAKPAPEISNLNLGLLFGSYAIASASLLFPNPYSIFAAFVLALFAIARIVFGARRMPAYLPFVVALAVFLGFILFFPAFDWPLRVLAGRWAAGIFEFAGFGTGLGLIEAPEPKLLMLVDGRIYEVAAECNGYGLISTSVLFSLLLTLSRGMPAWWKGLGAVLAAAVGFAFNVFRIIGIVFVAPYVPDYYDLMHEAAGFVALLGALGSIVYLIGWPHE